MRPRGKGKCQSTDNTIIGIILYDSYQNNEEVFEWKAHTKEHTESIHPSDMWCCLYCVFTYIVPLLIDKDISEYWNVLSFLCACSCVPFIWRPLHLCYPLYDNILVKTSLFMVSLFKCRLEITFEMCSRVCVDSSLGDHRVGGCCEFVLELGYVTNKL
jgi:hypothetical protein